MLCCSHNELRNLPSLNENLTTLSCENNVITVLPSLPISLKSLHCNNNFMSSLPLLPENILNLHCNNNKLNSLPSLPNSLKNLHCHYNQLTSLPELPNSLEYLNCNLNKLTSLPEIPTSLNFLDYLNTPIYRIVNSNIDSVKRIDTIRRQIQIINRFRFLYYSLKFKKQFRKFLWEKIREPKIQKYYSPDNLIELLRENEEDVDEVLSNW